MTPPFGASAYDRAVRARPDRLEGLPDQYFATLLGHVSAAAADGGAPLVDLGRGNPEVGPPPHVVERLAEAARQPSAHGYSPFRGLPALREAIAVRYAAAYLNYPSNPCAVVAPPDAFEQAVRFANESGAAVVHDFAYGDLVFDGRRPRTFLATPGARDVGVEMFSMSKTYGMAGWRLGFVVGNAELVERINLMSDHSRVGIFAPLQDAAIAALTGPDGTR